MNKQNAHFRVGVLLSGASRKRLRAIDFGFFSPQFVASAKLLFFMAKRAQNA
jgi:hypothetical protein